MRTSSRRSSGPVMPLSGGLSSSSVAGGLRGGATSANSFYSSASAFASSSTGFSSRSPASSSSDPFFHHHHHQRSASPTRVHLVGSSPPRKNPAVRFSLDQRSTSPGRSLAVDKMSPSIRSPGGGAAPARRTCMCSPTTHPGSFRCSLHKNLRYHPHHQSSAASSTSMRLNMRRSAMTNSLVRIGTVEGDLVKRALAALIRPSSHQQRRRGDFQPRPSRLSVMSKAEDVSS